MHTWNRPKKTKNHARTHIMLAALVIGNGLAAYAVVKQMNPAPRSYEDTAQGSELYAYKGLTDFPDQATELAFRADNFGETALASATTAPPVLIPAALPISHAAEIRPETVPLAAPRVNESRVSKRTFTHKVEYHRSEIVPQQHTFDTNISSRSAEAAASSTPQLVVVPPALPGPALAPPSAADPGLANPVLPYPLFGVEAPPTDQAPSDAAALPDPIANADEGLLDGDPVQAIRVNPADEPGIPVSTPNPPQNASSGDAADIQTPVTIESAG